MRIKALRPTVLALRAVPAAEFQHRASNWGACSSVADVDVVTNRQPHQKE